VPSIPAIANNSCRRESLPAVRAHKTRLSLPSRVRTVLRAVLATTLSTSFIAAESVEQSPPGMPGHPVQMIEQTPPDRLPPPRKLSGIGNAHIQISATPEAQRWFDQGLNLYHDFWDYESARAFQQAIRRDPDCAMCYWGLYKAESFFHSNAQGYAAPALAKAMSLQDRVSQREQLYIRATAADFRDAAALWRRLVEQYPDDLQAQIFLAQSLPGPESLSILERVMKADRDNSAANHYYIHALEASPHPERALHSAEILARLAPASGHMVHMPGHIFFRLGDYARAEQAFAASARVDERYMREQRVDPDDDWNYVHNLMYAVANLMEEGKLKDATALSMKLNGARGTFQSTMYVYSTRDSISRLDPRLPVALRTADWQQVLDLLGAAAVPADRPNLAFLMAQLKDFAAGMRAVEAHDVPNASQFSGRLDDALAKMTPQSDRGTSAPRASSMPAEPPKLEVRPDALLQPILSSLGIMASELRGALLSAQGKDTEATATFEQAAKAEKDLGYREPPIYIRPVYESQGAALMSAENWIEARMAYEKALLDRPRSGFALFGIALSSENSGEPLRAVSEYTAFLEAWKGADRSLLQVIHARAYLAKSGPKSRTPSPVDMVFGARAKWGCHGRIRAVVGEVAARFK
jgi:tetratricopeptide (TPR) repeat protein